mgnify:CR=1 FL=1
MYKEYSEFGSVLQNGAYQYAQNIDQMIESEYGRKILWTEEELENNSNNENN